MRPSTLTTSAALAGVLLAQACARPPASKASVAAVQTEFVAPPDVTAAHRLADGSVRILGHAPKGARVSLASPDGVTLAGAADAQGLWSLALPSDAQPRLFAVTATIGGRIVRAEGALVEAPFPAEPTYLARAGAASMPVYGPGALRMIAFDYDAGGGAGVAGFSAPGVRVDLEIDGVPSGAGRSDVHGRFSILAVRAPLSPGRHEVAVRTAVGEVGLALQMTPGAPLGGAPMRVAREKGAWRIDWAPPGGGVQTTLALTPSAGA